MIKVIKFCWHGGMIRGGKCMACSRGLIRLYETIEERIQKTELAELGTTVSFKAEPIEIHEIINKELKSRSHHITLVYECEAPEDYKIENSSRQEQDTGLLAWHKKCPDQLLRCHEFYREYFTE